MAAADVPYLQPTPALAVGAGRGPPAGPACACGTCCDADVLTPAQVAAWRTQRCAMVDGIFPRDLIANVITEAKAHYPPPVPEGGVPKGFVADFGSAGGQMEWPTRFPAVNALPLHPRVLKAAAQLLGVAPCELRLTQCDLWPKYGKGTEGDTEYDNSQQRIHCDFPNHHMTFVPRGDAVDGVSMILYLSDESDVRGATRVVPQDGDDDEAYIYPDAFYNMPGVGDIPWRNDRTTVEAEMRANRPEMAAFRERLYVREKAASFTPGTCLLYRHDVWHRGTPVRCGALRLVVNLTWRRADSGEQFTAWNYGWARGMYMQGMVLEQFMARASVAQRAVLGFPVPGHPHWAAPGMIEALRHRYGSIGMDVEPYVQRLDVSRARREASSTCSAACKGAKAIASCDGASTRNSTCSAGFTAAVGVLVGALLAVAVLRMKR